MTGAQASCLLFRNGLKRYRGPYENKGLLYLFPTTGRVISLTNERMGYNSQEPVMSRLDHSFQTAGFRSKTIALVMGLAFIVATVVLAAANASNNVPVTREITTPVINCTPQVLWDQIGSTGTNGTASQDFETANDAFDAEAAEDFMVTSGQTWTIQKVVARGIYFNGSGPADSFNVRIGTNPGSGTVFNGLSYTRNGDDFEITLPSGITLPAGIYWVSVQVRMDFTPGGQWAWANRAPLPSLSVAQWRNPGGGYMIPQCVKFADRGATCGIDASFPEQAFRLEGLIVDESCSTPTAFDYDGDHKTDISVFRQSEGAWYLEQSQAGLFGAQFGFGSDKITPADFDGDGKTDIAVYRPSDGIWYVFNSSNGTVSYYQFGLVDDLPTPADYDGDGKADVSVFRPLTGTWYRQNSGNGTFFGIQFGASEDKPIVGDFDGDGKSDIAVFRPSTGAWYWINSGDSSIHGEIFGFGSDVLTPADYDGDRKTDVAVFRPSDGYWYIRNSSNGAFTYSIFGLATDIPAPGDFDGDGKADINVFRPSDGTWYRQNSSNGQFIAFPFGTNGDKPTMTAFRY